MRIFTTNHANGPFQKNVLKLLAGVFVLFLSFKGQSQVFRIGDYAFTNTTSPYAPLVGDSTIVLNGSFDSGISDAINIVFPFRFGNQFFDQFKIQSNGWMTFNVATVIGTTTTPITTAATVQIIAPFARDLDDGGGAKVSILRTGVAPNRILKIQWQNFKSFSATIVPEIASFQVWLYETTNVVEMRYGSVLAGARIGGGTVQVGLKSGSTAIDSLRTVQGTSWPTATASNATTAKTISPTDLPDNNRLFRFTPFQQQADDVGLISINSPLGVLSNCPVFCIAPKATFRNQGTSSATYTATFEITGPGAPYTSTKPGTLALAPGVSETIIFDSTFCPSVTGTYNIRVYTTYPADLNKANDTLVSTVPVVYAGSGGGAAANAGYFFANSLPCTIAPSKPTFAWQDTTGSISLVKNSIQQQLSPGVFSGTLDDGHWKLGNILPPGEKFRFDGVDYDSFYVTTNGIIGLTLATPVTANSGKINSFTTQNIPSTLAIQPGLFPFWKDFNFGGTVPVVTTNRISYKVDAATDKLIITYDRAPNFGATLATDYVSFQVILEIVPAPVANGRIVYQYDDSRTGAEFLRKYFTWELANHTVGIQDVTGTEGIQYRRVTAPGMANVIVPGPLFGSPVAVAFGPDALTLGAFPLVSLASPTVTINQAVAQPDPTSSSPINFTVVFDQVVTGFATGDVTLSGTAGATTAIVTGSGTTYNVAVSGMTSSGTVVVDIPAGVAINGTNDPNQASSSLDNTVTFNLPAPPPPPPPGCTITAIDDPSSIPGGLSVFGLGSGPGTITVDHVDAPPGLVSLTVPTATNVIVTIPPFTTGTTAPVTVTYTVINPLLPYSFTLRASNGTNAILINLLCVPVAPCPITCPPDRSTCSISAPFSLVGTGELPAGGTFSGPGVSMGIFTPSPLLVGPNTITYTYTNGCTASCTFTILVYPAAPVITAPANTCNAAFALPPVTPVAGFTVQYSIDGAAFAAAPVIPTTPGCHTIIARYVNTLGYGSIAPLTPAPAACATSNTVSTVIFPPTPVGPAIANTCNTTLIITPLPPVPGFTAQYGVDNPVSGLSGYGTLAAAEASTTDPGCYEIQSRYVLTAACGATPAGTPSAVPDCGLRNRYAVRFPAAPVLLVPDPVCAPGPLVLPDVAPVTGFTVQYNVAGAGFTSAPVIPTTPGSYPILARYVTTAACGSIPAGTAGPGACAQSNQVIGVINPVPVVTTAPTFTICSNTNTNIPLTSTVPGTIFTYTLGFVTPGITGATPCAAGCGTVINQPLVNPNAISGTVEYIVTPTSPAGCVGAPFTITVTVFPRVDGVIQVPNNHTICAGQNGNQNIDLSGVPPFSAVFRITNLTTATSQLFPFTVNVAGPSNVSIPAAFLPNTTNTPITYRIDWVSLVDANGCFGIVGITLTGSANITVMPLPAIVVSAAPVGSVCPGSTIAFTVTAAPGNTVPATFNFVAVDNLGNIVGTGSNIAYATGVSGTFGLNCVNAINNPITFTFTPFANAEPFCPGPSVVRTVTVQDIVAPVLSGNGSITLECSDAAGIATARAFVPTATDACSPPNTPPVVTSGAEVFAGTCGNTAPYAAGETGTLTTIFTATDACGNASSVTQVITIVDTQAPTFTTAPGALNVTLECSSPTFAADLAAAMAALPTATDNCRAFAAQENRVKVIGAPAQTNPGTCITETTRINTITTTDQCGNPSVTYFQIITIQDNTGPVFSALIPAATPLNIGAGANCTVPLPNFFTLPNFLGAGQTIQNTMTDACGSVISFVSQVPAAGTPVTGLGGSILVTINVTDACGNPSSRTFTVTFVDQTGPTAVCIGSPGLGVVTTPPTVPATIFVTLNAQGNSTLVPQFFNNGSFDNCPGTLTYSLLEVGPGNGFNALQPPFTFGCDDVGPQTVRLVVTDASGNSATCDVNVVVRDQTAPVFTSCPATQTLFRDAGCVATIPNYITQLGIVATDACGGVTLTQSPIAGTFFGLNFPSTPVTITATDANGNSQTCVFTVNFVDNIPPVIACPLFVNTPETTPPGVNIPRIGNNFTVNTGVGNTDCAVSVTYATPLVTDNCAIFPNPTTITPVRIAGPASGGQFFVGVTTVTFRATDAAGNSVTCSFTVTVQDNTAPTITCTGNKSVNPNAAGCVFTQPSTSWDAVAFDNCLIAPVIRYTATGATTIAAPGVLTLNGQTFNQGVTTVTAQAFDNAVPGPNASIPCTFTVTVTDNTVPIVTCPPNVVVNAGLSGLPCAATAPVGSLVPTVGPNPDFCPTFLEWEVTGATPNSSGLGVIPSGFVFNQGVTTVAYRVTDAQLNSSTCSFTVTVNNVVTGAVSGTAVVQQNNITTSTVTFTGAGGVAPYTFTFNVNGGPSQTITTIVGNSITVAQSNAALGPFVYTLTGVQATGGCPGTVISPVTVTITVVPAGLPDLIILPTQSSSQITAGGTIQEVFSVRNIGTGPTTAPTTFAVNRFPPGSGLTATINPNASVTIGFDNFTLHNNTEPGLWTVVTTASQYIFTYTGVIAVGESKNVGITVTRGTGVNAGPNGIVNQTATVDAGTGGGETPTFNNGATVTIVKN